LNADLEERRHRAELIKHTHTMRQQIDANTKRLYGSGGFKYMHLEPGALKRQGGHQAADPASNDKDLHTRPPLAPVCLRSSMTNYDGAVLASTAMCQEAPFYSAFWRSGLQARALSSCGYTYSPAYRHSTFDM